VLSQPPPSSETLFGDAQRERETVFFRVKARRQKIQEGGQLGEEKLITAFRARSENKMCIFWCAKELAGSQQQKSSVSHKVVISPEIRKKGKVILGSKFLWCESVGKSIVCGCAGQSAQAQNEQREYVFWKRDKSEHPESYPFHHT
jgi:hypothetical protein